VCTASAASRGKINGLKVEKKEEEKREEKEKRKRKKKSGK